MISSILTNWKLQMTTRSIKCGKLRGNYCMCVCQVRGAVPFTGGVDTVWFCLIQHPLLSFIIERSLKINYHLLPDTANHFPWSLSHTHTTVQPECSEMLVKPTHIIPCLQLVVMVIRDNLRNIAFVTYTGYDVLCWISSHKNTHLRKRAHSQGHQTCSWSSGPDTQTS